MQKVQCKTPSGVPFEIRVIYRAREDVSHFVYGFVAINPPDVVKITHDKSDLRICKTEAIIFTFNKLWLIHTFSLRPYERTDVNVSFQVATPKHPNIESRKHRIKFRRPQNIKFADTVSSGFLCVVMNK
jgi:hypothetical protein